MSRKLNLFISHSSIDRSLTESVRDQLDVPNPVFELLLDIERLDVGRPWERYLHEWMARCNAALVLLTKNAVASDWVLKETTILTWRLSLDPAFKLFIARFPDVEDSRLREAGFGPLTIGDVQLLRETDAAGIAQAVKDGLEGVTCQNTPFDRMVGYLADLFGTVGDHTLETVARKLNVFKEWRPSDQPETRYFEAIARHLLCGGLGQYGLDEGGGGILAVGGLPELIGDLSPSTGTGSLKRILDLLSTHWVQGEAAGPLAMLPGHRERRAVAINGVIPDFTPDMYRRRALLADADKFHLLEVAGGNSGGLVEHYTQQICDAMREKWAHYASRSNDEIVEKLEREKPKRFVVLPEPRPSAEDLKLLLDRFPAINFVLWTGQSLDPDYTLKRVDWAQPPLDQATEDRAMTDYCDSVTTIREKGDT